MLRQTTDFRHCTARTEAIRAYPRSHLLPIKEFRFILRIAKTDLRSKVMENLEEKGKSNHNKVSFYVVITILLINFRIKYGKFYKITNMSIDFLLSK